MKPGEIINQDKLINAQKNLTDLRIFHQATVRAEESDTPDHYDVIVEVMERNHYELTYGGRYDTERNAGAEVQLTDLNLFGTGQSMSVYTRYDQRAQLYRLVYHSPTLSGLRWKTLISTSFENGELLLLDGQALADLHRRGATIALDDFPGEVVAVRGPYEYSVPGSANDWLPQGEIRNGGATVSIAKAPSGGGEG